MSGKIKYILLAVAVVAVLAVVFGGGEKAVAENGEAKVAGLSSQKVVPIEVTPARKMLFRDVLKLQGNLEARDRAVVSARVGGIVEHIFVREGDAVKAGETILFQTDDLKLRKALEIAKQQLSSSKLSLKENEALKERAEADLYKISLDYNRYKGLYEQGAATKSDFDSQESAWKQAKATLKYNQTLIDIAAEAVRQSESNLTMAEKDLQDTKVKAPISGYISAKYLEEGEMAAAGTAVLRIEDTSCVEVSGYAPDTFYPRVKVGKTKMSVIVNGIELGELPVSYKSPTINSSLRTFEVKCVVNNPADGVVPGAMADISLLLESHEAVGIKVDSLLTRDGKHAVFLAEGSKAKLINVDSGLLNGDWIEITSGSVDAGSKVVSRGQFMLNDGDSVKESAAKP